VSIEDATQSVRVRVCFGICEGGRKRVYGERRYEEVGAMVYGHTS
jgi:hypothetical protein